MKIQHQTDPDRGFFYIDGGAKRLAEMVYVMAGPTKMIIEHTEVDESLKGQRVGEKLLEALVEFVRKAGIKVIPLCPFANAIFKKRTDLQDVLT